MNDKKRIERIKRIGLIKKIAQQLVDALKAEGIVIQRYDAYSTNSVYLKLDYGMLHSIRISDHPGKDYLKYRYNVMVTKKGTWNVQDKYPRYYFGRNCVQELVTQILRKRELLLNQFVDEDIYTHEINKRKWNNEGKRGFWEQAVEV